MTATTLDSAIARIAARQHGNVTRAQLLEVGLRDGAIAYRGRHGRLHRVHPGVYSVGYRGTTPLARAMAAVLACGPGSVLSHRWAAGLWELSEFPRGSVDVTRPGCVGEAASSRTAATALVTGTSRCATEFRQRPARARSSISPMCSTTGRSSAP